MSCIIYIYVTFSILAFGRCGDLSTAFTLVDEMAEKEIVISSETFNFLLQACITDKDAGFRHALLVNESKLKTFIHLLCVFHVSEELECHGCCNNVK
jgi:pentatricopeptide repeat protein